MVLEKVGPAGHDAATHDYEYCTSFQICSKKAFLYNTTSLIKHFCDTIHNTKF